MTGTHIKDFTKGNITRQLIAFSWPLLLSNLLQDGCITKQGTHSELMARGGFYATLYGAQFT